MVTLNALSSASSLLQQVSNNVGSTAPSQTAQNTIQEIVAGSAPGANPATKSVSSAIFNAVTSVSEKQDETVKAVLNYLDETYTKIEERHAYTFATANPDSAAKAIQDAKAMGERLKQQVLADPSAIHKLYEQIRMSRPDTSMEGVMSLLVVELNNRHTGTKS